MGGMTAGHRRPLMTFVSCTLLIFSVGILISAYEFGGSPASDPSRYQLTFVPVMAALFGIPLLTVAAVFYQLGKANFRPEDRWLILFGCAMYVLSLASFVAAVFFSPSAH
jgi:hypothetical protein